MQSCPRRRAVGACDEPTDRRVGQLVSSAQDGRKPPTNSPEEPKILSSFWRLKILSSQLYGAAEFLSVHEYVHVQRWADAIAQRPAVQRGRKVNRLFGEPASQLHERHDASDFDTRTQDKMA